MSWLELVTKTTGKIKSHRTYLNLEYVIYIAESEDGCADFYLSSENWLCSEMPYDEAVEKIISFSSDA
jgi:hypothetical protein